MLKLENIATAAYVVAALLFILALAVTGLASAEPPDRIARLSYVEGQIKFQGGIKRGIKSLMPEEAYRDRDYQFAAAIAGD